MRLDGFDPLRMGLNRNVEWRALRQAATEGLAPAPVYRNPDLGALICDYREPDPSAVDSLAAVASLLRRIHALPPVKFRLDPLRRAWRYAGLCGRDALPIALLEALERLEVDPPSPVLCHNDLLTGNRLISEGRLLALDWEYAAMGDPLFDLAVIVEGDRLTEGEAAVLHEAWLGHAPAQAQVVRLADQRLVYRELAGLWEEAMSNLAGG